jgi:ferredoxin-NADP reductase/MOSC domain-containing protein YiiM
MDTPVELARPDCRPAHTGGVPDEPAVLISVNVGLPRDVAWRGKTVRTGIWKAPVTGPRLVRRLNIDGDGQGDLGGHGGEQRAVYVYQLASYRYWAERLGRDDFVHGQFGENFTITGLPDDEVCIGDRYRIGDALFEVTQPRVTCYRLGIRMREPTMAALLTSSGRPGFYLRVLQEGTVQAGQEIIRVASGPERMTVAEANALLYRAPHPGPALERALRIPALSPGWRASFQALLDQPAASGGNPGLISGTPRPPAWAGFRTARIVERRRESSAVWSFVLEPDAEHEPFTPPLPGQFLTLRFQPDPTRPSVLRSYSLSGPPSDRLMQISVKREEKGTGSRYLVDHADVGDTLDIAAPRGTFVLQDSTNPVVLMSAGVGATPVLAMLYVLAARRSRREVWWLHGTRNRAEHAFAGLVDRLLAELSNSHRHVRYSRPGPDDALGVHYDAAGRLTAATVADLGISRDADHYLCGPPGFLADLPSGLTALGVPSQQIRTEVFGAALAQEPGVVRTPRRPPHEPEPAVDSGPAVSFARSGVNTRFGTGRQSSLLELAEACDVPVRWSCRTGVCHSCETDLLAGAVSYEPEPIDVPPDGRVLVCCARPATDVVLGM